MQRARRKRKSGRIREKGLGDWEGYIVVCMSVCGREE